MDKTKIAKNSFIGIIWRDSDAKTCFAIATLSVATLSTPTRCDILIIGCFEYSRPMLLSRERDFRERQFRAALPA